jgi:hypothetical protein
MGHFTLTLPGNRLADVRWGTERKINGLLDLLPWRKKLREERRGYIVKIGTGSGPYAVYHLFKTKEGQWQPQEGDETAATIKTAIDTYERNKL